MEHSDEPEQASEAVAPVNDIFDAVELASAVNFEEFKHFLDHVPIAVIVSKSLRGEHRIVYANKAFEVLTGRELGEIRGRGWTRSGTRTIRKSRSARRWLPMRILLAHSSCKARSPLSLRSTPE